MNKRPHPSAGVGGVKPVYGSMGQAPPLPAGPVPSQQAQPAYDQNAHAAAWQAYYQQQAAAGISPQDAYAAAAQPAQASAAAGSTPAAATPASTAANPYSNYGYGAGASLPTTQPPVQQAQYHQQHQYPAVGPQQPQQYPAGQYQQPQQGYNAWQGPQGGQAGYGGPPGARPLGNQTPYVAPSTPYQAQGAPYNGPSHASPQTPVQGAGFGPQQPVYNAANPNPMQGSQARPFSPAQGPQAGGFPPAKRPRFDGPAGPAPVYGQPARGGFNGGRGGPGGMTAVSPHRPSLNGGGLPIDQGPAFNGGMRSVSGASSSSRGGFGGPSRGGRGGGPGPGPMMGPGHSMGPIVGPGPIMMHGGPGPMRGGVGRGGPPNRGGPPGRGGGHNRGGFNSGGPPPFHAGPGMGGPPRGPGSNKRPILIANNKLTPRAGGPKLIPRADADSRFKLKENDRTKAQLEAEEKLRKTVMTDFRIVGIEIGNLDWSWGEVGEQVDEQPDVSDEGDDEADAADDVAEDAEVKVEHGAGEGDEDTVVKTEEAAPSTERGKKRKAKGSSPDLDDEARTSSKKRSSTYRITHRKQNEPLAGSVAGDVSANAKEPSISRLRIYFNCPPDTEKPPKRVKGSKSSKKKKKKEVEVTNVQQTHESAEAPAIDGSGETEEQSEETVGEQGEATDVARDEVEAEAAEAPEAAIKTQQSTLTDDASSDADGDAIEDDIDAEQGEAEAQLDVREENVEDAPEELATAVAESTEEVKEAPSDGTDPNATPASIAAAAAAAAAELAKSLELSAQNTIAAYGARSRGSVAPASEVPRRASVAGEDSRLAGSQAGIAFRHVFGPAPASNRLVILYENNTRRLCFDAACVDRVCIFRKQGRIDVHVKGRSEIEDVMPDRTGEEEAEAKSEMAEATAEETVEEKGEAVAVADDNAEVKAEDKLDTEPEENAAEARAESAAEPEAAEADVKPKEAVPQWILTPGISVEVFNEDEGAFVPTPRENLETGVDAALPPLQQIFPPAAAQATQPFTVSLYLNKLKPLSEPKWCRTGLIDEWLEDTLGVSQSVQEQSSGWRGKIEIMDPDTPPTMQAILEQWSQASGVGSVRDRRRFIKEHLKDVNNLIEILLRLTRGERSSPVGSSPASLQGPLASALRQDSVYASHQTHVSLAVLAMYRLTTEYAVKAGEEVTKVDDKVVDIIKSLPMTLVHRSLDGLFKEWAGGSKR